MQVENNIFERWHVYGVRVPHVIAAGTQYLYDRVIQIQDLPGPYYLRQLQIDDGSTVKAIRCRNGQGDYFMGPDFAPCSMISDILHPLPIWCELEYPFNSAFRFDVKQLETEAFADLWVLMHGAHRIMAPDGLRYYPDKYHETGYTHSVNVTLAANQSIKIPLYLFFNTPFAIRQLTSGLTMDNPTATFETLVVLRDENGRSFANIPLPYNILFPTDGAALPLTPSPELVIPAGSSYTLEIMTGAGVGSTAIQFSLQGALLNAT